MAKLMAFLLSIVYFFGSFGIGTNPPLTLNVTDRDGDVVAGATVYYVEINSFQDMITCVPIGTTDENGSVQWEDQQYGEQKLLVSLSESPDPVADGETYSSKIDVSRFSNDPVTVQLDVDV